MSFPLKRSRSYGGRFDKRPTKKPRKAAKRAPSIGSLAVQPAYTRRTLNGSNGFSGLPAKKTVTLHYATEVAFTGGVTAQSHVFRLNSVYDPLWAAGGNQPLGFDQWAAFYGRYTVKKATIKAQWAPGAVGNSNPSYLTIGVSLNTANITDVSTLIESAMYSNPVVIGAANQPFGAQSAYNQCDIAKVAGVKDAEDDDLLGADIATNPDKEVYGLVSCAPVEGNTMGAKNLLVQISYEVTFSQPKQLSAS